GVTAGDGDVVVADVGRGIRGCAVDVDGGLALVVGVDGVLVGGDVRIALGVDHELDVFAGLAVLDGEGDTLVLIDEVSRRDRLRRDGQLRLGGRSRGLLRLLFDDRDRHRLRSRLGLLVGAPDAVFAGFERRFALDRAADRAVVIGGDGGDAEGRLSCASDQVDLSAGGEALSFNGDSVVLEVLGSDL